MSLTDKSLRRISAYNKKRKRSFDDQLPGGKADTSSPLDFSKEQLIKGVVVEYEHTDDFLKALEISMDHLSENPKYYDHLEDMEAQFDEKKAAVNYIFSVIAATYYGDKDPYERSVVERQDDWARVSPGETNVENWKNLGGTPVTEYHKD